MADKRLLLTRQIQGFIRRALREDLGSGDLTSRALIPPGVWIRGAIVSRDRYILCGLPVAIAVFRLSDSRIRCRPRAGDGDAIEQGQNVLEVEGPARGILAAERTALNFLQRLTGIATLTHRFVRAVGRRATRILDTRKTTPGWRVLEKYAVRCGGGTNHRMRLDDGILIKDNHRRVWQQMRRGTLADAVRLARRHYPRLPIEIEVESLEELRDALAGNPDWILLDNFRPHVLRRCVAITRRRAPLEASGGITLRNVRTVAATGVDAISIGALTHSAPAADLALELASIRGDNP